MRTALTLFWVGSLLTPLRGFNFFPFALDPPITLIRWTKEAGLSWSNDIIRWEPIMLFLFLMPLYLSFCFSTLSFPYFPSSFSCILAFLLFYLQSYTCGVNSINYAFLFSPTTQQFIKNVPVGKKKVILHDSVIFWASHVSGWKWKRPSFTLFKTWIEQACKKSTTLLQGRLFMWCLHTHTSPCFNLLLP